MIRSSWRRFHFDSPHPFSPALARMTKPLRISATTRNKAAPPAADPIHSPAM